MWILDTDHLSVFQRGGVDGSPLRRRLEENSQRPAVTVVTLEEQLRGWLALIKRAQTAAEEVTAYGRLLTQFRYFERWSILPWDGASAAHFANLRAARVRVGSMDLRIASIALAHEATLLTRNLADFGRIPGLKVENWLDRN